MLVGLASDLGASIEPGESETGCFGEGSVFVLENFFERQKSSGIILQLAVAEKATVEGFLTNLFVVGCFCGHREPFRGAAPLFRPVVVRSEIECGGFDKFSFGPV